jgi:hypothetical protein
MDWAKQILNHLHGDFSAVVLFGSHARGQNSCGSDIDILQVVQKSRPNYKRGDLSVSVYTSEALKEMAIKGNLFILHLVREAQVITDPELYYTSAIAEYRPPGTYAPFFQELRNLSRLLRLTEAEYDTRWLACHHLLIFLLRSTLYAVLAERGQPCFAMKSVAQLLNDPEIVAVYHLKNETKRDWSRFAYGVEVLEKYLKVPELHSSLESVLFENSLQTEFVRSLTFRFVRQSNGVEDYAAFKATISELEHRHR